MGGGGGELIPFSKLCFVHQSGKCDQDCESPISWKCPAKEGVCCVRVPSLFCHCSSTATSQTVAVCLPMYQSIHLRTTPPLVIFAYTVTCQQCYGKPMWIPATKFSATASNTISSLPSVFH